MPSFDVVSEVDLHELNNAIDQANREVGTRFDFKGVDASFKLAEDSVVVLEAEVDFQIQQMMEILKNKMVKRSINVQCLKEGEVEVTGRRAQLKVTARQGIDSDLARSLVKRIKESKIKVQAAIQGDKLRVTGKQRDDLQQVIAMLREADVGLPLQFNNFRD